MTFGLAIVVVFIANGDYTITPYKRVGGKRSQGIFENFRVLASGGNIRPPLSTGQRGKTTSFCAKPRLAFLETRYRPLTGAGLPRALVTAGG